MTTDIFDDAADAEYVQRLIAHEDARTRLFGRLLKTWVPDDLKDWVRSETEDEHTDRGELVLVLIKFTAQVLGALAHSDDTDTKFAETCGQSLTAELQAYFATRAEMEAGR